MVYSHDIVWRTLLLYCATQAPWQSRPLKWDHSGSVDEMRHFQFHPLFSMPKTLEFSVNSWSLGSSLGLESMKRCWTLKELHCYWSFPFHTSHLFKWVLWARLFLLSCVRPTPILDQQKPITQCPSLTTHKWGEHFSFFQFSSTWVWRWLFLSMTDSLTALFGAQFSIEHLVETRKLLNKII